jgi:hypothetical protein
MRHEQKLAFFNEPQTYSSLSAALQGTIKPLSLGESSVLAET